MAITDIDISETLEAGAPPITYKGAQRPHQMASDPGMGDGPFMMEEFLEAVKKGFSGT